MLLFVLRLFAVLVQAEAAENFRTNSEQADVEMLLMKHAAVLIDKSGSE